MERIKYKSPQKLKGIVGEVFVTDGDPVTEGQTLAIISTQGDKFEILSHVDGIVKNVYIIESLLVSHGDIIFDIYTKKDIKKIVQRDNTLGDTLRLSLKKAGYLDADDLLDETETVDDFDFSSEDEPMEKEKTMRFKNVSDNNENNMHGDLPTDQQFNLDDEEDITFEATNEEKTEAANEDEGTLGINIPSSLATLDDLSFEPLKNQKIEEPKEETLPIFDSKKLDDVKKIEESVESNDFVHDFATFQLPQTTKVAEKRVKENDELLKKAVKNAISYDSVTQVLDGNVKVVDSTISPVTNVDKLAQELDVKEDFSFDSSQDLKNIQLKEKKAKPNNGEQEPALPVSADDLNDFMETSPSEMVQTVKEQVFEEKKTNNVDISDATISAAVEAKVANNSFLSNFEDGLKEPEVSAIPNTEIIYSKLANEINTIAAIEEDKKEEDISGEVDEKELNRIESLLDVDVTDLEVNRVNVAAKSILQAEATPIIDYTSLKTVKPLEENAIKTLINDETGKLSINVKNNNALIKDLGQKLEELKSQIGQGSMIKNKATVVKTISKTTSELVFDLNVTALMNLHSMLVEPFSSRGQTLTFGAFAALAASKAVDSCGLEKTGIKLHSIEDLTFNAVSIAIDNHLTIADVAKALTNKTANITNSSYDVYDLTSTTITTASITNDEVFTIIIGKIKEDETLTGTMSCKLIFDSTKLSLNEALKLIYSFNSLIENPGFLI